MGSSASRAAGRRVRSDRLLLALTIVFILVVSVALTMRQGADRSTPEPARFSGSRIVLPMPSLLASAALERHVRVAVVRDAAAASFYDRGASLDSIVEAWRTALAAAGAEVRMVRSDELGGRAGWPQVLVIPSSPCLTVATREAMDAAGSRGQGLLITGATGAFDAGCRRIGYGLVVALTAASRVEPLESRPMVYVTLAAATPLTVDIPPGARLDVKPAGQIALRHAAPDGYYSDYASQPAPAGGLPLLDGAISHGRYGGARVVYWGFEPRDAVARPWNDAVLALLVRNSVRWAAGLASAAIEPWPDDKRAAAVLAQDVEDQFGNARHALDSLRAAKVRGTYFLTSDLARRNPRLTRLLKEGGELGTHSENHRLLGGTPADAQRRRLAQSQRDLTELLGHAVSGLRPPQEQFDLATMQGWLAAGGTYMLGANDGRTVGPELLAVGGDTLVLLSRNGDDDFGGVREGHRDVAATSDAFLREYRRIRSLGGLYILNYHSQLLASAELVPALARVARTIGADTSVWATTAGTAAVWWRTRAGVDARVAERGAERLDVVLRNGGGEALVGAVARIDLGSPRRVIRTSAVPLASEPGVVRLRLPPIPARSTRTVSITFAPERAAHAPARRTAPRRAAPARRERSRPWWAPWRW